MSIRIDRCHIERAAPWISALPPNAALGFAPFRRCALFEFDRPVGLVEEGLPRLVLRPAKAQRNCRIALGFHCGANEFHTSLRWGASALARVALDAGADEIRP